MKFKIHDIVIIKQLTLPGRVRRVQIEESGILYETRYFWNSEAKSVWFYEDELENSKTDYSPIKPFDKLVHLATCQCDLCKSIKDGPRY